MDIDPDFIEKVTLVSLGIKLLFLFISLLSITLMLRFLDRLSGVKFHEWINDAKAASNHTAIALYYAIRFAATCWLIGAIFS